MKIPIYMAVTHDRFELPVAFDETEWGLARKMGITEGAISKGVARHMRGLKSKYVRVWIELDEEETAERMQAVRAAKQRAGICG